MVDCRTTWCGIHWLGWVSFLTLIVGVAGLMTAIAMPYFYTASSNGSSVYLGLWNFCADIIYGDAISGSSQTFTSIGCFPIDASCNSYNGELSMTSNCSTFHAMTAVLVLSCVSGGLAIFVNWAALAIMLAHGSVSTFVVKTGGFLLSVISGSLGLLTMILTINEKSSLWPNSIITKNNIAVNYHASFAVLIIGWVFVLLSAVSFVISARRCGGGFNSDAQKGGGNFTDDT